MTASQRVVIAQTAAEALAAVDWLEWCEAWAEIGWHASVDLRVGRAAIPAGGCLNGCCVCWRGPVNYPRGAP